MTRCGASLFSKVTTATPPPPPPSAEPETEAGLEDLGYQDDGELEELGYEE